MTHDRLRRLLQAQVDLAIREGVSGHEVANWLSEITEYIDTGFDRAVLERTYNDGAHAIVRERERMQSVFSKLGVQSRHLVDRV